MGGGGAGTGPYVASEPVVRVAHEDEVAAFLHGHGFVISLNVASGIGKVSAQVMHRPPVGVEVGLLELENGLQGVLEHLGVGVEKEGGGRKQHVQCIDIAYPTIISFRRSPSGKSRK